MAQDRIPTVPTVIPSPVPIPAAATLGGALLGAALGTALAGLHLSRAHGPALAVHALAGLLGLLLALAAVVRAGRHARHSHVWAGIAVATALVAVGIALVDTAMLGWYAFARLLEGT